MRIHNRPIVLYEPGPETVTALGDTVKGAGIEHALYAERQDRGGHEETESDTQFGTWETRWRMRKIGIESVDHTWTLRDEKGKTHDIVAPVFPPKYRRDVLLYTVLRS